jgi:olfactory receptor
MSHTVCTQLVAASWISAIPVVIGQTFQMFSLPFCESNRINYFICDIHPVVELVSGDIFVNKIAVYILKVFSVFLYLLIFVSYIRNTCSYSELPSARGRAKASPDAHLT